MLLRRHVLPRILPSSQTTRAALSPSAFARRELRHWGHSRVPLDSYAPLAIAASRVLHQPLIHVQTASEQALRVFNESAVAAGLRIFYTQRANTTSTVLAATGDRRSANGGGVVNSAGASTFASNHDNWGGWRTGLEMHSAIVAAVNLQIALDASILISPTYSAWTTLLVQLMSSPATNPAAARRRLCCSCAVRDHGGNLDVAAARSVRTADLDLLTASSHLNYTVVHRGGVEESAWCVPQAGS